MITYEQRKARSDIFLDNVYDTLNKKGNDYASSEDAFSNFRNTASVLKIPVAKVFLSEIVKKVSRITELLEKDAQCESINDSVLDIAGYACLLDGYLWLEEKEDGKEEKGKSGVVERKGLESIQSVHTQVVRKRCGKC